MLVQKSLDVAKKYAKRNISIEVIDLRTLVPFDLETILNSLRKTGKVLIAHEDNLTGGFGGEIAARISEQGFEMLDGPIMRVAAKDCHIPFATSLESEILPQEQNVFDAVDKLLAY
jgi:pyruvate/2-oxoglutarate/acetoin dehydrogenase E1 component